MNSAIIRTCERVGLGLGIAAVVGSIATGQAWEVTIGVALGAALALLNFYAIRVLVTRVVEGVRMKSKRTAFWAVLFGLKLAVVVGILLVALKVFGASPMGFFVGVTAVFGAVIISSILMALSGAEGLDVEVEDSAQDSSSGRA